MLVVTGALAQTMLASALAVVSELTAALSPVARLAESSAWTATWTFDEEPVDGDSILPALAAVSTASVPSPLRLSWGVMTVGGEYVPLAFRSTTVGGAATEADVNAADLRSRYKQSVRPDLYDELNDVSWWELVTHE